MSGFYAHLEEARKNMKAAYAETDEVNKEHAPEAWKALRKVSGLVTMCRNDIPALPKKPKK